MSTMREHLKKFHSHAANHHDELAECYWKIAGFGKAAKSQMKDGDNESLAECLQKIADTHEAAAEFHRGMMAECEKVAGGDELNKSSGDLLKRLEVLENSVIPTRVVGVIPDNPMRGLRAIPRTGGQALPEKPVVPLQFSKLVEIEE